MFISGVFVLFAAIVIARVIHERAFRALDSEAKLRLMDGFSRSRAYSMVPLLILIGAYWYFMSHSSLDRGLLGVAYFGLLIVYIVVRSLWNQVKLVQLDMPAEYRRMFTMAQVVSLLGVAWFFFAVLHDS